MRVISTNMLQVSRCLSLLLVCAFISTSAVMPSRETSAHLTNSTRMTKNSPKTVSYNHRAILIDGKPTLLITGAIHYPRSSPTIWPYLFRQTKEAGINTIDTYVFWNLHEPIEGQYDFVTGYANLPLFLELAHEYGLYVNLRIGPYICAEWTFGGIPYWLLRKPGMQLRTINKPFQDAMEIFIKKVLEVVHPFLAPQGGPIIMLQMENEYGNVQKEFGSKGDEYILWAADLAHRYDVGIPWIMCQQDGVPYVLLTCNGFYCDEWIGDHFKNHPNQTAMFTELWSGWFQNWGSAKPQRPAQDIAYSVARWVAKGGTYFSYYMWHGGTNFARWAGSYKVTSYDYDAPLSEAGYPSGTKYAHLAAMHQVMTEYSDLLVSVDPLHQNYSSFVESHIFRADNNTREIAFVSNIDSQSAHAIIFDNNFELAVSQWTVLILTKNQAGGNWSIAYSTSAIHSDLKSALPTKLGELDFHSASIQYHRDSIGKGDATFTLSPLNGPQDQLLFTIDKTDYMWYVVHNLSLDAFSHKNGTDGELFFEQAQDVLYIWIDDVYVGTLDALSGIGVDVPYQQNEIAIFNKTLIIPGEVINRLESSKKHSLRILCVVNGLNNYGSSMQTVQKGILGKVKLNDVDITNSTWYHHAGLEGESMEKKWQMSNPLPIHTPLIWYRIVVPKSMILKMIGNMQAPTLNSNKDQHIFSFSISTETLGRGYVWVNGNNLGRFWNAKTSACNSTCTWNGTFWGEKCLTGCGGLSQSSLHVPAEFLLNPETLFSLGMSSHSTYTKKNTDQILAQGKDDVEIIVLEEKGGDPSGARLSVYWA